MDDIKSPCAFAFLSRLLISTFPSSLPHCHTFTFLSNTTSSIFTFSSTTIYILIGPCKILYHRDLPTQLTTHMTILRAWLLHWCYFWEFRSADVCRYSTHSHIFIQEKKGSKIFYIIKNRFASAATQPATVDFILSPPTNYNISQNTSFPRHSKMN